MKRYLSYSPLTAVLLMLCGADVEALPPLGFTPIGPVAGASVEIMQDSAYITVPGGVRIVDSEGNIDSLSVVHPIFGVPNGVTRVVQSPDGHRYVGANFSSGDPFSELSGAAIFRLDDPTQPIVSWMSDLANGEQPVLSGVDRNLRGLGNLIRQNPEFLDATPSAFFVDGSVEPLPVPDGEGGAFLIRASPNGYAIGEAHIPGTAGSSVGLWSPDGSFSFVSVLGYLNGILRDRSNPQGINVGLYPGPAAIQYGDRPFLFITDADGELVRTRVLLLSQSDFAVLDTDEFGHSESPMYLGFFPGIVPDDPTQALPLFEVFPELAAVNFDRITDLAAVDGYIYMTLVGEDGLYLFGARDPSVIPEPDTAGLAVILIGIVARWRRSWSCQSVRESSRAANF